MVSGEYCGLEQGALDYASAYYIIPFIKHSALARSNALCRFVEAYFNTLIVRV